MKAIKARVVKGKFVIDMPAPFPDGTELQFQIADEGDDLDEAERAALDAALDKAWASVKAGHSRPASELIKKLRRRNRKKK